MTSEVGGQLQLLVAPILAVRPGAMDNHDGPVSRQPAIWPNARDEPASDGEVVPAARKRDVLEAEPEAGRCPVNRRWRSINELFGDIAGDSEVADTEGSGDDQECRDHPPRHSECRRGVWCDHVTA